MVDFISYHISEVVHDELRKWENDRVLEGRRLGFVFSCGIFVSWCFLIKALDFI